MTTSPRWRPRTTKWPIYVTPQLVGERIYICHNCHE